MPPTADTAPSQNIFGLPHAEIRSLVSAVVGAALETCRLVERQSDLPGMAAEKMVGRFAYRTVHGRDGHITLFWKRMYGLDIAEAHQYRFLADHDLPTPALHGVAFGGNEEEIIVLEHLRRIGIRADDAHEVRAFASLLARLNAVRLRSEDPWKPQAHEIGRQLAEGATVAARMAQIWQASLAGTWGRELEQWCRTHPEFPDRLTRYGKDMGAAMRCMPRAILHEDYTSPNVGWRHDHRELLLFDLHRLSLGPRFWDAGNAFGTAEQPAFASVPWQELVGHYLAELDRYGGSGAPLDVYAQEIVVTRQCAELDALKWHLRAVHWTHGQGRNEQQALIACQRLLSHLQALYRMTGPAPGTR